MNSNDKQQAEVKDRCWLMSGGVGSIKGSDVSGVEQMYNKAP